MTDYIGLIVLIVLCVAALIGLIVGFCKGFMEVSSWANEYVIAALGAILIGVYAGDTLADVNAWLGPVVVLGGAIVLMIVFMIVSASFRKGFEKGIANHRRKIGYKNMDAQKEADEDIVAALSKKNFKQYRKLTKKSRRKFRQRRGGWGVVDRVFGAITGAIKYFVVLALILVACLIVLDLTGITVNDAAITDTYLSSIYQSDAWAFVQPYLMDFILVGAACACVRRGYKSGLFSGLWTLLAIVLVVLGFYVSWLIVSNGSFDGAIASLSDTLNMGDTISKIILTIGLGLIFMIVIILLAIFIPKAIDAARETKVFKAIDGVLGAIVVFVIVMGILLFLFGMLETLDGIEHEPEIFVKIGTYLQGGVGRYFYSDNILNVMGWMPVDLSQYLG